MNLWQAIITDLTASKEKKVFLHVTQLLDDAQTHIRATEQQFRPEATKIAAECRKLVINLPRGEVGYDKAHAMYFDLKQKRSPLHASALIASKLLLADHVVTRAGEKGYLSIPIVAMIQKHLEEFFQRHGVPAWKVVYYDANFFDVHRD